MSDYLATVLLVEDDTEIRRFLHAALGVEGYKVVESANARRGAIDASSHRPDLAIVDLGLPDFDGLEVIKGIRAWSEMPILVLSARSREHAKLEAFDAGADDYVTKPFGIGELLARVRIALRHRSRGREGGSALRLGTSVIDLEARRASRDGRDLHLTPIEYRLVGCLARHLGRVVSHRELLSEVWGPTHQADTHYLRIYLKRLRDKLEADPMRPRHFLTETGVGYRLVADE